VCVVTSVATRRRFRKTRGHSTKSPVASELHSHILLLTLVHAGALHYCSLSALPLDAEAQVIDMVFRTIEIIAVLYSLVLATRLVRALEAIARQQRAP